MNNENKFNWIRVGDNLVGNTENAPMDKEKICSLSVPDGFLKIAEVPRKLFFNGKLFNTEMYWRPIETAPLETNVLIYDGEIHIAKVYQSHPLGKNPGKHANAGMDNFTPTHWMPLPEEPDEAS